MGNLSGHTEGLPPLFERDFDYIDLNNFDAVMKRINPTLKLDIKDTLSEGEGEGESSDKILHVELTFQEFGAFHPSQLIRQIPRLWKLYQTREKLLHAKIILANARVAEIATDAMKTLKKGE